MWSKLTNAIKARPGTPSLGPEDAEPSTLHPDVMGGVYDRHPNLSVFHPDSAEVPFPSPSPPPSPSRRKGLLKRISKNPFGEHEAAPHPPRLNITLPKKVKSSIYSFSTGSDISVNHSSDDTARLPPNDNSRPPATPTESKFGSLRAMLKPSSLGGNSSASESSLRVAHPAAHPNDDLPPTTPLAESKFGSLRSILRPGNTPGTGQSVRFFSRDAYKIITPEISSASELEDHGIESRFRRAPLIRAPVQELFSQDDVPPTPSSIGSDSMMLPMPPPNIGNIFDISSDREMPTIPNALGTSLLADAVEISEPEDHHPIVFRKPEPVRDDTEQPGLRAPFAEYGQSDAERATTPHDRSQSFSFGQSVFHSLGSSVTSTPASDTIKFSTKPTHSRNRAVSDTVFQNMIYGASGSGTPQETKLPEADINEDSPALVVMGSPEKEKDPFGAHATTYYTPGTMLPPSPPTSNHTRKASREEDIIWSLRTQLALQSELCAQFELDLGARDELVQTLSTRLADTEKECERRKSVARNWRKRVADLEKCVRSLEEEVDRSREESVDRSVMDEASGEALRMLHRRIGDLERERTDNEAREKEIKEQLEARIRELEDAQVASRHAGQADPEGEIKNAQAAWDEERTALLETDDALRHEQANLQSQLADARKEISKREQEMTLLRGELEAQWKHTEKSGEETERLKAERNQLEKERDALRNEMESLHERVSALEADSDDGGSRRAEMEHELEEAWRAKEEAEQQRDELEAHLHVEEEHADELTRALQEREDRVTELSQERHYAQEGLNRMQENLRQRDAELANLTSRIHERDIEVDELHAEVTRMKRDHSRIVDEQSRKLSEVVAREVEARAVMEQMLRNKAEIDVSQGTMRERVEMLQSEVEKLRRHVHELQQESADKEVKLTQMSKQRAQDKEDLQGLNIALDSKQQELELLKRRVATTSGRVSTGPAATATKAPYRRESSIFGTPSVSRPPSVLSDSSNTKERKERKNSDPPTAAKAALARSLRQNTTAPASAVSRGRVEGSMGAPPIKRTTALAQSSVAHRTPSNSSISSVSSFSRSPSATPTANTTVRRATISHVTTSSKLKPSPPTRTVRKASGVTSASEGEGKENVVGPSQRPARRLSAIPA